MKRILIFSLQYHPFVGGAEVALKEITDRLDPGEFEFHMVTLRFDSSLPRTEKVGNILVHRIGLARKHPSAADLKRFPLHFNKHLYQLLAFHTAGELHWKYRYDAVWAMMAHGAGIPAGVFKTFYPKTPYLLSLQEGDPPEHIERLAKPVWPLFKRAFTKADEVQAISTPLLAWAHRMGFRGEGFVIPNGVDVARFSREFTSEERQAKRAGLGIAPDEVSLVTTSRLVPKNGLDTVIRALPLLPSEFSFTVYGIGPEEGELRSLAHELGVEKRVRFMGQIGHEEMPLALAASDIFIRPSRSEGMGNSFIEAMAAELPVIATQEGGIADFLFDLRRNPDKEPTGFAVSVDSPREIAEQAVAVLSEPERTRRVVSRAKRMVEERYDWNRTAMAMRSLFSELIEKDRVGV